MVGQFTYCWDVLSRNSSEMCINCQMFVRGEHEVECVSLWTVAQRLVI